MSNNKTLRNQYGLAHLGLIVVILVVLGGVGFAAYRVSQKKDSKTTVEPKYSNTNPAQGKEAAWEKAGTAIEGKYADADVLQIDEKTWRMYYAVQPEVKPNNFEVYSATSTDGKTWKQEPGIRKTMATFPDVVKLANGKYRMYYQSAGVIKSALSDDGLTFKDESGTRIDKENSENLTFDNVAAPTVAQMSDGTFVAVYRGTINTRYAENTPNQTTQLLMWATSADGLTFTKKGIAIDSRNETLAGQLDGPELVKWDDEYKVFMTSYTGVYEAKYAKNTFSKAEIAFAGSAKKQDNMFMGQPPGDPTLAKIDNKWFMYYGGTGATTGIHYALLLSPTSASTPLPL